MAQRAVVHFPPSPEPPPLDDPARLAEAAAEALGIPAERIADTRPRRLSFDGRRRERRWRVELDVYAPGEEVPAAASTTPPTFGPPDPTLPRVVVVGSGPAGMYAALDLLAAGFPTTVLERGRDAQTRRKPLAELNRGKAVDPDCNYCFGEGGAGTYSDGKLYARSGRKEEVRAVLETLVAHGAPPEILTSWRPHVGSNRLPKVVVALRETILRAGGEVRFGLRAEELETAEGPGGARHVRAVVARNLDVTGAGALERLPCDAVVLAAGHSALDALLMARRAGARLEPKGFAMGVRIEHPQPWLDRRQYDGLRDENELPPSFYELSTQVKGRGVYSFCMCPGGFIVPTTTGAGRVVVNGMSLARRDSPFANSGLVVAVEPEDWCGGRGVAWGWLDLLARARELGATFLPEVAGRLPERPADDPLFGVRLQLALETVAAAAGGGANRAPVQRADQVLARSGGTTAPLPTSYRPGLTPVDLRAVLPRGLHDRIRRSLRSFDENLPGYASDAGQLVGVETRTSSPVRVARDPETLASAEVAGLYPCGEGAGYAGGIVSAALDGRRVAARIVEVRRG